MSNPYAMRTNPFEEDDDVDDETFLKNSRRTNSSIPSSASFDEQLQSFQDRKRQIEERTINSTEKSISILRDSEQIGVATAEELMRQREKLEKTDRQLDEINQTLRFSQKHINGIKSVFSSLKNYMSGRAATDVSPTTTENSSSTAPTSSKSQNFEDTRRFDVYESHPGAKIQYNGTTSGGSKDFSAKLDANLQEMCSNISRLKNLATDMSFEIDSQNDLIGNITDKAEIADITIKKQNKDMNRILGKK